MKKTIAVLLVALMIASMSVVAFAAEVEVPAAASYTATKTTKAITIDGVKDDAYSVAAEIPFSAKDDGLDGYDGKMQILFDGSYLYAFIEITDGTWSGTYNNLEWCNNTDSVWVGFNDTDCWAFERATTDNYRSFGSTTVEFAVQNMNGASKVSVADAPSGVTGYNVEVKIPYTGNVGSTVLFGAFACIDVDNDAPNLSVDPAHYVFTEGRIRTSYAVSSNVSDNGIWNAGAGMWDGYTDQNGNPLGSKSFFDTLNLVDAPEEVPEAGDSSNAALWTMLLTVSFAGMIFVFYNKKREA